MNPPILVLTATAVRKAAELQDPLFKKRAEILAKIPHFWTLVFEQAPPEIDSFIQPSDAKLFAECLETIDVTRFELNDPKGHPRSVSIKFGFGENEYFEDKVLEKKFWHRRSLDGWEGLVSEPVKIHWKKGKDLTGGLTDAAHKLFEAKKKAGKDAKHSDLPEYKKLASRIEDSEETSQSFFTWFGFVSSWKWVSAEESEKATKLEAERAEKRSRGEEVEDLPEDDLEDDHQETEVFPGGDEFATIFVEDMWPSAIKYYSELTISDTKNPDADPFIERAHEQDDEDISDLDEQDLDDEESGSEIDIRALVGKGKNKSNGTSADAPPAKKQRKA